jgi:hypothetical protein
MSISKAGLRTGVLTGITEFLTLTDRISTYINTSFQVPCHNLKAYPRVADGGDWLQVRIVAGNILNKQSRTATGVHLTA